MMTQSSTTVAILRYCIIDIIGSFLHWPLWWYSRGLYLVVRYILQSLGRSEAGLGVRLMLVHMFQPMYGQNDREGRIISFVMRLVLLISRAVVLLFITVGWLALLLLWLLIPMVVIVRLISFFS